MTEYVKFISETEIAYPKASDFPGVVNPLQHDSLMRDHEYFPLTGKPEPNAGKILKLDTFAIHRQTKERTEAYEITVEDYEDDPEHPGQKIKVNEHKEWRERTVEVDDSYISVESYHFEDVPAPEPKIEDYDRALEKYLRHVQFKRGYTLRDPALYANSSNPRWAQDAIDWTDFRDRVMEYGLEIENQYASTGIVPVSLEDFIKHLHTIKCNWTFE